MSAGNVADLFVETLHQAGVERIYGVVGDSLNGLTEALRTHGTIEWVHVRHEEVAAFAAAGEVADHRKAGRLRRVVRPRQPASDQRPVRRPANPHAGAGDRGADPLGRDRWRLLPGDASPEPVPRMQRLLRARLRPAPAALRAGERDPRSGRAARRRRHRDARGRGTAAGAGAGHVAEGRAAAAAAHGAPRRGGAGGAGVAPERRGTGHLVLRSRLRRCPSPCYRWPRPSRAR